MQKWNDGSVILDYRLLIECQVWLEKTFRKSLISSIDLLWRRKLLFHVNVLFHLLHVFFLFFFTSSLLAFLIKRLFFNVMNLYGVFLIFLVKLHKYNLQVKTWKICYMKFLLQVVYHKNKYKSWNINFLEVELSNYVFR